MFRSAEMLRVTAPLVIVLLTNIAYGAQFQTNDPLKAFVHSKFPLGNDYFIRGNKDYFFDAP